MNPAAATIPRRPPLVLADCIPGALVRDALLVIGGACLVGLLAQVSIHLSFTPVPITGQTLGVLLTGTALGWRRGLAAMLLYAAAGLVGVPWFAGHASGYAGASFGFIIGFMLCASQAIALGLTPFLVGDAIKAALAALLLPAAWSLGRGWD